MAIEIITDKKDNKEKVLVPLKLWEKLMDELDELDDIRLAEKAKKEGGRSIPFEDVVRELGINFKYA